MTLSAAKPFTVNGMPFGSLEEFTQHGHGCATPHPNHYQIQRNDARLQAARIDIRQIKRITIDVQFLHIVAGKKGVVSEEQRRAQIQVLNRSYAPAGIDFTYEPRQVRTVVNADWFRMDLGGAAERQAKAALHASPERHLNLYTAGLQPGLLGWATFPWELEGDREMDGVAILHSSLPGGKEAPFNLGMTAVHEVGHWLGLYHTFQGGCKGYGDRVGDTVAHAAPNYGRPKDGLPHNACKAGAFAPIHNYMNYSDDAWLTEITKGQIERVKKHVAEYRPGFVQ